VRAFFRVGGKFAALSIGGVGVLLASQQEMMLATPPNLRPRNVTGAGDALMAGLAYGFARGLPLLEIARWGAAFSAAVVSTESLASVKANNEEAMLPRVDVRTVNVM
jgi:fructose-1-phosphate kinase PfkB-like protein